MSSNTVHRQGGSTKRKEKDTSFTNKLENLLSVAALYKSNFQLGNSSPTVI